MSMNIPKCEFTATLYSSPVHRLEELRTNLFKEAKHAGLTDIYSVLVTRKDAPTNPVKHKFIDDNWCLVQCIKCNKVLPPNDTQE